MLEFLNKAAEEEQPHLEWLGHRAQRSLPEEEAERHLSGVRSLTAWTHEFKLYPMTYKRKLQISKQGIIVDFFLFF